MSGTLLLSTIDRALEWARSQSLWYITAQSGCCANEVLSAQGCRYDLERFGCLPQETPGQADLLIVCGAVSQKAAPHLRALYEAMLTPKYVMAVGACSNSGGPFAQHAPDVVLSGADQVVPVDVHVPGCPPRPESIMHGLIRLQSKIRGRARGKHGILA